MCGYSPKHFQFNMLIFWKIDTLAETGSQIHWLLGGKAGRPSWFPSVCGEYSRQNAVVLSDNSVNSRIVGDRKMA